MNIKYYCNNLINNFTKPLFRSSYQFCRLLAEFCARNCLKYRYLHILASCKIVTLGYCERKSMIHLLLMLSKQKERLASKALFLSILKKLYFLSEVNQ
jgi:hypothetical protein